MALSADEASEEVAAAHADEVVPADAEDGQVAVADETELWKQCLKDVAFQMENDDELLDLVCRQKHFLKTTRDVTVEEVDNNTAPLAALSLSVYNIFPSSLQLFLELRDDGRRSRSH